MQIQAVDWNAYKCSQLHSILSLVSEISMFTLLAMICFQGTDFININGSCYCKRIIKWNVDSIQKLSEFYTAKVVKSYFHLYGWANTIIV